MQRCLGTGLLLQKLLLGKEKAEERTAAPSQQS